MTNEKSQYVTKYKQLRSTLKRLWKSTKDFTYWFPSASEGVSCSPRGSQLEPCCTDSSPRWIYARSL